MVRSTQGRDGEAGRASVAGRAPAGGNRREEILAIAASIFARKGVVNTTVRDIAKEAGMLSGSLYHYFQSKEEMLDEIIRNVLEADAALAASEDLEPRAAVRELFQRGMMFAADHPDIHVIVSDSSKEFVGTAAFELVRQRDRAIRRAWMRVLERGIEAGAFRADLDPNLAWQAMIAVVVNVGRWYRPGGAYSMEQIADVMARLFLEGFEASGTTGTTAADPRGPERSPASAPA